MTDEEIKRALQEEIKQDLVTIKAKESQLLKQKEDEKTFLIKIYKLLKLDGYNTKGQVMNLIEKELEKL